MRQIGDIPQPDRAVEAAAGQGAPIGAERHRYDGGAAGQDRSEQAVARGIGDIPQPDRAAAGVASGQRMPVGAEGQRIDGVTAGWDLAEQPWVGGIGDVPQLDGAAVVAAGQHVPIGAERHRQHDGGAESRTRAAGQGLAERAGVRGIGDVP